VTYSNSFRKNAVFELKAQCMSQRNFLEHYVSKKVYHPTTNDNFNRFQ